MTQNQLTPDLKGARYEYRVWGKHPRARKLLEKLADEQSTERVNDCYLLVDDSSWNAKIRDNTLKIKQLVAEHQGFEQWTSNRHRSADSTPTPFDAIFEQLRLDRPQRGKKYNLPKEIAALDPNAGVRAVFVTKERRRYRIGDLRAEATDIEIRETGEVLRTLLIEGDDLDQLAALRKRLGLRGENNVAVHHALDLEIDRS
jgi:propanediol dehydratase small subunit